MNVYVHIRLRGGRRKIVEGKLVKKKMKLFWDAFPNENLRERIIIMIIIIIKEEWIKLYLSSTATVKKIMR